MSVWSVSDVTQGIAGTLRKAARATGAGFDYLLKTAQRESSLNPAAKATSSSAAGMFQFVEQTWLEMVNEAGPKYGLDAEAAAISRTANGRYVIANPKMRENILALRHDAEISSLMAGEFTERNRSMLTAALRRPPSEGELYAAHFLGAQGAVDLIRLASVQPDAKAASYFPEAASANRSIFYANGRPRNAADVLAKIVSRHDTAPAALSSPAPMLAQGPAGFFSNAAPADGSSGVVMAYAEDRPVFHSMFQTARRPPVSSYVQGIWSDLVPAGQAGAGGAGQVPSTEPLDLSSFLKPGTGPRGGV